MICIILIEFVIIIVKCEKFLSLNMTVLFNSFNVQVGLGEKLGKYFEINTSVNFSYVCRKHYSLGNNDIYHGKENLPFLPQVIKPFELVSNSIFLNDSLSTKINEFYFYFYNDFLPDYDSLSFTYKFHNIKTSIIHTLYDSKIIDKLQFGFECGNLHGKLFIGGIPSSYTVNEKFFYCNVNKNYYTWGCDLKNIIIGNKKFQINQYIPINLTDAGIVFSEEVINYIKNEIFEKKVPKGICKKELLKNLCNDLIFDYFPNITLDFNDDRVFLLNKHVFELYVSGWRFIPDSIPELQWQFGIGFFKHFFTLFDYQNSIIKLYYNFNYVKENMNKYILIFLNNNSLMLFLMSIFSIYQLTSLRQ